MKSKRLPKQSAPRTGRVQSGSEHDPLSDPGQRSTGDLISAVLDRGAPYFSVASLVIAVFSLCVACDSALTAKEAHQDTQPNIQLIVVADLVAKPLGTDAPVVTGTSFVFTNTGQTAQSIIGIDTDGNGEGEQVELGSLNDDNFLTKGLCPGNLPLQVGPGGSATIRVLGVSTDDLPESIQVMLATGEKREFEVPTPTELEEKSDLYATQSYILADNCQF